MKKRYSNITEVEKSVDHIEEVQKFNPYHGKDGRFTSAGGGGGMAGPMMAPDGKGGAGGGKAKDDGIGGVYGSAAEAYEHAKNAHDQWGSEGIIMERDGKYVVAHSWREHDAASKEGWKLTSHDKAKSEHENKPSSGKAELQRNKDGFVSHHGNGAAGPTQISDGKALYNATGNIKWGGDGVGTLGLWTDRGQTKLYVDGNRGARKEGDKVSYTAYGDKSGGGGEFKVTYNTVNGKTDFTTCEVMEM